MSRAADQARRAAEESDAADAGAAWFQCYPDALLIEAWHHAESMYGPRRHQVFAFYLAIQNARRRRDEYQAEEAQP